MYVLGLFSLVVIFQNFSRSLASGVEVESIQNNDGDYEYEKYALSLVMVYAVVYLLGSARNRTIANRCMKKIAPLFEEQFQEIGFEGEDGLTSDGKLLHKEGQNVYLFYATGRRFCRGCLCSFRLKARQDLLSYVLYMLLPDFNHDFLYIDIPMNDLDMDQFVFSIVRADQLDILYHSMPELSIFPRLVPLEFLPKSLSCLTDWDELVEKLMPPDIKEAIRNCEAAFELMHLSDQNSTSLLSMENIPKKALRFRFRVPSVEKIDEQLVPLLKVTFDMIDLIGNLKIPSDAKPKVLRKVLKSKMKKRVKRE